MTGALRKVIDRYHPDAPLAEASTPPADWYLDPRIFDLERQTVFARCWHMAGRADQVAEPGRYVTSEIGGEPILAVRGSDRVLRGFFNVCRHHAAAVLAEPEGFCNNLRCPYHGWTYNLNGELIGTPEFAGVQNFAHAENGLVPVEARLWENWLFVKLHAGGHSLDQFLGNDLKDRVRCLTLQSFTWMERRVYSMECNWKVFVDNYLDGGYHVPHVHSGLDSVLDYSRYSIETGERYCLQSSPLVPNSADGRSDAQTAAVRKGERAFYYWIYPNLMINCYDGMMDTNLVCPRGVDRTDVIFDYYFADISPERREYNRSSIAVSETIQDEDAAICNTVQRGLRSRAYEAGRLSVRREAGEHLFHRLLYADLKSGLDS
jgi:choline monooxygenase